MRAFEVNLTVDNCMNCPFQETDAYENYYCSVAESDLFTARKTVKENREKITETCPYFEKSKEV